jgi:hypothetical protein
MIPVQPKSQQMNYEGIPPCDLRFLTISNLGIFLPIGKQEQAILSKDNLKNKYRRPQKLLVSDGDHLGLNPVI